MQCSCGGETRDHKIQRNKIVVCEYVRCVRCGRQHIIRGEYPKQEEQHDIRGVVGEDSDGPQH